MPHDVVASTEQHEVAYFGRSAVGPGAQVVHVAERGWLGAALRDATPVSGGDGTALCGGDLVGQRGEADDLAALVEHDAFELRLAQQRLDLSAGSRACPRCRGAVRARVLVEIDEEARRRQGVHAQGAL